MKKGNKLLIYNDVYVLLTVETTIRDQSFPVVHVLRKVQEKTAYDISTEIKELKKESLNEEKMQQWKKVRFFVLLPWFMRKLIYKIVLLLIQTMILLFLKVRLVFMENLFSFQNRFCDFSSQVSNK